MSGFELGQHAFSEALRDPNLPPPTDVTGPTETLPRRRFNVYRNNVYAGLIGVLEARYPAIVRLVGEEFFRAMARLYVDQSPPSSPVLLEYGRGFPAFVAAFEPVADVPYLPDVARLEWQLHEARNAADCRDMPASDLAAHGEAAAFLTVELAPAVSLVRSPYPVFSIWRANTSSTPEFGPSSFSGAESVLVTRPFLTPEALRIPPGYDTFIDALHAGKTIGDAASVALAQQPEFPLSRAIALLITQKAIVSVARNQNEPEEVLS